MSDSSLPPIRHLGTTWLAPGLGEPSTVEVGSIVFHGNDDGVTIGFRSLDDLDAVIGELHAARYRVAYDQRQSAEKDRTVRHYGDLLAEARADVRTTGDGDTAA